MYLCIRINSVHVFFVAKVADKEGVAPRTAEWRQETDTIKWP